VEWCENRLLGTAAQAGTSFLSLADFLLFKGMPAALVEQVEATTRVQSFGMGDEIVTTGQTGDGRIFFIESGQVSILVPLADGAHHRVASLGPGMNFGEMVLLGQTMRSATVSADTPVRCRSLETSDLERIAATEPLVKIILLENLARDIANSLRRATKWISVLA